MKRHGVTLLELLIGVSLFSVILTLLVLGLQTSNKMIQTSSRNLPIELSLQNAMDACTRIIRESADINGGGTLLYLTQWDGTVKSLSFSQGTLSFDGVVLQTSLESANFLVSHGEVTKVVTITLSMTSHDSVNPPSSHWLVSSVSLRNIPAASSPTLPPPTTGSTPPAPAPSPSLNCETVLSGCCAITYCGGVRKGKVCGDPRHGIACP